MSFEALVFSALMLIACLVVFSACRVSSPISRKEEERDDADAIEHFTKVPK